MTLATPVSSWMRSRTVNHWRWVQTARPGTGSVDWKAGDEIVVTTTDYLPGHSEKLQITVSLHRRHQIDFEAVDSPTKKIQWPHNGVRYGGPNDTAHKKLTDRLPDRLKNSLDPTIRRQSGAETRAAVALLSRSIRIVSAGDSGAKISQRRSGDRLFVRRPHGHPAGLQAVQIQGRRIRADGPGRRLGHYPVHFHMARQTPANYLCEGLVDQRIDDALDRAALDARRDRWRAMSATSRSATASTSRTAPRPTTSSIPISGSLPAPRSTTSRTRARSRASWPPISETPDVRTPFPYRDRCRLSHRSSGSPTAGTISSATWRPAPEPAAPPIGSCPVLNSDMAGRADANNVQDGTHMKWSGLRGTRPCQSNLRGATPLKSFYKNYATSTMMSFQTTGDAPSLPRRGRGERSSARRTVLKAVRSIAPDPAPTRPNEHEHYYPHARRRLSPRDTLPVWHGRHTYDCSESQGVRPGQEENCAVTVLDHFTSAFHWAEDNFAAIWLRHQWYLMTNSVLSDVQNGGLTFITGGDYTHSSVINGYWALAEKSIFIGRHAANPTAFCQRRRPVQHGTAGLTCDWPKKQSPKVPTHYCLNRDEGVSMPLIPVSHWTASVRHLRRSGLSGFERLSGYQDGRLPDGEYNPALHLRHFGTWPEVPKDNKVLLSAERGDRLEATERFLLPARIPFDQFVLRQCRYPALRRRSAVPGAPGVTGLGEFRAGRNLPHRPAVRTTSKRVLHEDCPRLFNSFTAIDRQTVLNDDDGSLTGLSNTISINEDVFFRAPVETAECKGNLGVSPSLACPKANPRHAVNRQDQPL